MINSLRLVVFMLCFIGTIALIVTPHFDLQKNMAAEDPLSNTQRSGAMEAMEFWTRSRAYPDADIPKDRYYKAYEQSKTKLKEYRQSTLAVSSWESIGPTNLAGRMISVILNPQNPYTIYAGSASGGLWRSYKGGLGGDWHRVNTGYPVLGVKAIAISPTDSNTIYIGTGEVYRYQSSVGGLVVRTTRGSFGMGILKSTNNGLTWTKSLDWSYNQQRGVQAIEINPLNPNTVWAATTDGIYKSIDAGGTWNLIAEALFGQDIVIHSTDTNKVIVSSGNFNYTSGVFRTTDGGNTWNQLALPGFTGKTILDKYYSNPNIVYASVADSTTGVGSLWRTTNFGTDWAQMSSNTTNNIFSVQGWYSHYVAIHPFDSSIIVHNSVNRSRSTNSGVNFTSIGSGYSDNHACAYHPALPNILYSSCDDGIYRSTNFGSSFTSVNTGLKTGQFYNGFSNSATDSLIALGQVQDHIPGYKYQGSTSWARSAVDEVGWTAIDQTNDNIMYAASRSGQGLSKSTNRGVSFFSSSSGFSGTACWNAPFIVSPSNPNVLYFGRSRIFKSINAASGWSSTNGNLVLDGNPALSMAISPTNPDTVYAGTAPLVTSAHIFRTVNGGTSWEDITGTLPDRYPMDITVDPQNTQTVYVVFGGFGTGRVFKSTNAGSSWTDISGTLPDVPTTAAIVDPLYSDFVYVGNDIGVYVSTNGGSTWNSFNDGFPEGAIVSDLTISPSNRMLRAVTHGNGVFQRRLPNAFPLLSLMVPNGGETWEAGSQQTIIWSQALVSNITIEYSTNNGTSWLVVSSNVSTGSKGYNWIVPFAPTSQAIVRITSTADSTLRDQSDGVFSINVTGTLVSYNNLWNLISLPRTVTDSRKTVIFPSATSDALAFEGSYVEKESLSVGHGYWLKFGESQFASFLGDSIITDTIEVVEGWNLIGSISEPIATSQISSIPPNITTSQFFGYDDNYEVSTTVSPGKAYWVKISQTGSLILSSSSAVEPTNRIRIVPISELPPSPPEREISEANDVPSEYALSQNYPNPFNPSTIINYELPEANQVVLKIFNTLGQEVLILVDRYESAGFKSLEFNARSLSSGIYFYNIQAGTFYAVKKMLIAK